MSVSDLFSLINLCPVPQSNPLQTLSLSLKIPFRDPPFNPHTVSLSVNETQTPSVSLSSVVNQSINQVVIQAQAGECCIGEAVGKDRNRTSGGFLRTGAGGVEGPPLFGSPARTAKTRRPSPKVSTDRLEIAYRTGAGRREETGPAGRKCLRSTSTRGHGRARIEWIVMMVEDRW
jgi:hypothetical protein